MQKLVPFKLAILILHCCSNIVETIGISSTIILSSLKISVVNSRALITGHILLRCIKYLLRRDL